MAKLSAFVRIFALLLCLTAVFAQEEEAKAPKVTHASVGNFVSAGAVYAPGLAIYNTTSESFVEFYGPSVGGSLQAYTVNGNNVFLAYQNNGRVTIYRYDGMQYFTIGRAIDGTVNKLMVTGNTLYVAGNFNGGFENDVEDLARIDLESDNLATTYFSAPIPDNVPGGIADFYILNDRFVAVNGNGNVYYADSGDDQWTEGSPYNFQGSFAQDGVLYLWANSVFINTTYDQVSVATTRDGENYDFPINDRVTDFGSVRSVMKVENTYFAAVEEFGFTFLYNYTNSAGEWQSYHPFQGSNPTLFKIGDELVIGGSLSRYIKRAHPIDSDGFYFQYRNLANIASFNNGNPIPIYNGGFNGQVNDIKVGTEIVVFRGFFNRAYNVLANGIAGYDSENKRWIALGEGFDFNYGGPVTAAIDEGIVYVGGSFSRSANQTVMALGKIDTSDMSLTQIGNGLQASSDSNVHQMAGTVGALKVHDGSLYVGGSFSRSGNLPLHNFARWSIADETFTNPAGGVDGGVSVFDLYKGKLVVAGSFSKAGNMPVANIALYDTKEDTFEPIGTGVNGFVSALAVDGGDLIACGSFSSAGGRRAVGLAIWNGNAWAPLKCNGDYNIPCMNEGNCRDVKVMNGDIYWVNEDDSRIYRYDGDNNYVVGSNDMQMNSWRGLVRSAEDSSKLWTIGLDSNDHTAPHTGYGLFNPKTENWEYSAESGFSGIVTFTAGSSALKASLMMVFAAVLAVFVF